MNNAALAHLSMIALLFLHAFATWKIIVNAVRLGREIALMKERGQWITQGTQRWAPLDHVVEYLAFWSALWVALCWLMLYWGVFVSSYLEK